MTNHFSLVLRHPRPEEGWNPSSGPFHVRFKETIFPWKAAKIARDRWFQTRDWDIEVRVNPTGKFNGWYTIWRSKVDNYV